MKRFPQKYATFIAFGWIALSLMVLATACRNPFAKDDEGAKKDKMQTALQKFNQDEFETLNHEQHEELFRIMAQNKKVQILEITQVINSNTYKLKDGRTLHLRYIQPCSDARVEANARKYAQKVIDTNGIAMVMPEQWELKTTSDGLETQVMVTVGRFGMSIGDLGLQMLNRGFVSFDASQHGKMESSYLQVADEVKKSGRICSRAS